MQNTGTGNVINPNAKTKNRNAGIANAIVKSRNVKHKMHTCEMQTFELKTQHTRIRNAEDTPL